MSSLFAILNKGVFSVNYQAIAFDLDGVLCHTDEFHYQAWKEVADKLNIYFDRDINQRLRGVSRMESFDIILERYPGEMSQEDKNRYATEKNAIYQDLLRQMSPEDITPEVRSVLEKMRENGVKMAIASSSKNAGMILDLTDLRKYFEAISDGNNISHSKPDPEVFEKAAQYMGISVGECLAVDDAVAGIESGKRAGMATAAVGMTTCTPESDFYLTSFKDLISIVIG